MPREESENLYRIGVEREFAIGQRTLLLRSGKGNIRWDCVSLMEGQIIQAVKSLGGLSAIAISHPHYYSSMLDWSRAFGGVPIVFWEGETKSIGPGLTLVRCEDHFEGGTDPHLAESKGDLLTGDIVQMVPDRRHASFKYSYPNYILLNAIQVNRIAASIESYQFEKMFGAWWNQNVAADAKAALLKAVARHLRAIE